MAKFSLTLSKRAKIMFSEKDLWIVLLLLLLIAIIVLLSICYFYIRQKAPGQQTLFDLLSEDFLFASILSNIYYISSLIATLIFDGGIHELAAQILSLSTYFCIIILPQFLIASCIIRIGVTYHWNWLVETDGNYSRLFLITSIFFSILSFF